MTTQRTRVFIWIGFSILVMTFAIMMYLFRIGKLGISAAVVNTTVTIDTDSDWRGNVYNGVNDDSYFHCMLI